MPKRSATTRESCSTVSVPAATSVCPVGVPADRAVATAASTAAREA
jgi:hypothetical protein